MTIAQKSAVKKAPAAAKKAAAPAVKAAAKKVATPLPAAKKAAAPAAAKEPRASYDRQAADDSALLSIMRGMREACEQKKIQKLVNAIRAQGFAVSMGRAEKLIPLALAARKQQQKLGEIARAANAAPSAFPSRPSGRFFCPKRKRPSSAR